MSEIVDELVASLVDPKVAVLAAIVAALGTYVVYTVPAVRTTAHVYLNKFMKRYDNQIMELLEKHLTKAQKKAFYKLEEVTQEHVKNKVLRNIILTYWDEHDDDLVKKVKSEVRSALNSAK